MYVCVCVYQPGTVDIATTTAGCWARQCKTTAYLSLQRVSVCKQVGGYLTHTHSIDPYISDTRAPPDLQCRR